MFQGVHLQKCGEVLRYLGSDTSFTSRLPPGVELNGSSTTLLGAATLVVVSNGSLCDLLVCGVALVYRKSIIISKSTCEDSRASHQN